MNSNPINSKERPLKTEGTGVRQICNVTRRQKKSLEGRGRETELFLRPWHRLQTQTSGKRKASGPPAGRGRATRDAHRPGRKPRRVSRPPRRLPAAAAERCTCGTGSTTKGGNRKRRARKGSGRRNSRTAAGPVPSRWAGAARQRSGLHRRRRLRAAAGNAVRGGRAEGNAAGAPSHAGLEVAGDPQPSGDKRRRKQPRKEGPGGRRRAGPGRCAARQHPAAGPGPRSAAPPGRAAPGAPPPPPAALRGAGTAEPAADEPSPAALAHPEVKPPQRRGSRRRRSPPPARSGPARSGSWAPSPGRPWRRGWGGAGEGGGGPPGPGPTSCAAQPAGLRLPLQEGGRVVRPAPSLGGGDASAAERLPPPRVHWPRRAEGGGARAGL